MTLLVSRDPRRRHPGMSMKLVQRAIAACVFLTVAAFATEGLAQATGKAPPAYPSNDLNGVDLSSGRLNIAGPSLSIGPEGGLSWSPYVVKYEGQLPDSLAATMQEEVMSPFDDTIPNAPKIFTVSMPNGSLTYKHIGPLGSGAYTRLSGRRAIATWSRPAVDLA